MRARHRLLGLVIVPVIAASLVLPGGRAGQRDRLALAQTIPQDDGLLAPYVATPQEVVDRMLELAEVRKDDVVYDLGSGDGRIVITAARRYSARGIGFEIDPDLVQLSRDNARRAGVSARAEVRLQDVMTVDLSPASVVTLYLFHEANLTLRPRLLSQLRPGSRIVSHDFHMGDWVPERVERLRDHAGKDHTLFLWRITERPKP